MLAVEGNGIRALSELHLGGLGLAVARGGLQPAGLGPEAGPATSHLVELRLSSGAKAQFPHL